MAIKLTLLAVYAACVRVRPAYAGEGRYFVMVPEGTVFFSPVLLFSNLNKLFCWIL